MFQKFKFVDDIESDDAWWKDVEQKLQGTFFDKKNSSVNNLVRGRVQQNSRKGIEYQAKSRSCKKDFGFVIVERGDADTMAYMSEKGMTSSIPHQDYYQFIEFQDDNRCKPDRGVFLSKNPDIKKICLKRKHEVLDGFLIVVEYIKRECQFIHGTPLVWLPSERDFTIQWCFPAAIISFRDKNAPPPPPEKSSKMRDRQDDKSSLRKSDRDRESSRDRDRDRERDRVRDRSRDRGLRDRDRDRVSRSREDRDRDRDRDRRDRGDDRVKRERRDDDYKDYKDRRDDEYRRDRSERSNGRDSYPTARDRDRKEKRHEDERRSSTSTSTTDRWPTAERSGWKPEERPNFERRESFGRDMNSGYGPPSDGKPFHSHGNPDLERRNSNTQGNGSWHLTTPKSNIMPTRGHQEVHKRGYSANLNNYGGNQYNNNEGMFPAYPNIQQQQYNNHDARGFDRSISHPHTSPPDTSIATPEFSNFNRRQGENHIPRGRFPSDSNFPNSPGYSNSPHMVSPSGKPDLSRRHSEQLNAKPFKPDKAGLPPGVSPDPRREYFIRRYVETRIQNRRKKPIEYWSGKLKFLGNFSIQAAMLHYLRPHSHQIAENSLEFSRIPGVFFKDIRDEILKLKFGYSTPFKSTKMNGVGTWHALAAYIKDTEENRKILQEAFHLEHGMIAEVQTSKICVVFIKLGTSFGSCLNAPKEMMPLDNIPGYAFLIYSPVTELKEFKQVQISNREVFMTMPAPLSKSAELSVTPANISDMLRDLSMEINSTSSFHTAYREHWKSHNEHLGQVKDLTAPPIRVNKTISLLAQQISADRYSQVNRLLDRFTLVPCEKRIKSIIREVKMLIDQEHAIKRAEATEKERPSFDHNHISNFVPPPIIPPQIPNTPVLSITRHQPQATLPDHALCQPSPKVRVIERQKLPENALLRTLDKNAKQATFVDLCQAAVGKSYDEGMLDNLSFAELILLRNKNSLKIVPPAHTSFDAMYVSRLSSKLKSRGLFLDDSSLKGKTLSPFFDEEHNRDVRISIHRKSVEHKVLNVMPNKFHPDKSAVMNALPKMKEKTTREQSFVVIGDQRPNFTISVNRRDLRHYHIEKIKHIELNVLRITQSSLRRLRLGQTSVVNDVDASDEEEERKGGMQQPEILLWLKDIEMHWNHLEDIPEYPRYTHGSRQGEIIDEYPSSPMVIPE